MEISVIMPVFNSEAYLKEAIDSILNQTFEDFEFIIINDGSSDNSLRIINNFEDERIVLINQKNKGIIASLNKGLETAKGEFIARMDSDDVSLPDRFEKQLKLMKSDNIDICGGNFTTINSSGISLKSYTTPRTHDFCTLSLLSKVPFAHPSVIIRSDFLKKYNLKYGQSNIKKAEDLDLWIRIHEKGGKFSNVNETIFKYRIINNSLSSVNNSDIIKETKYLTNKFLLNKQNILKKILSEQIGELNSEEQSITVRAVFRIYFKKFQFKKFQLIKNFNKKTLIRTLLSEVKNLIRHQIIFYKIYLFKKVINEFK